MADNTKQFRWIVVIEQNLDWMYADDPNVFVAGDLFWYLVEGRNTIVNAPDVMVVFGRPKSDRGSYKQWEEEGIAPQVVFEIRSPSNSQIERFDLSGAELQIYRPDGSKFYSYVEICQLLEQEKQRAQQAERRVEEMEALLKQYRDRFGDLPDSDG
jgi:Uma2 family endonuclease